MDCKGEPYFTSDCEEQQVVIMDCKEEIHVTLNYKEEPYVTSHCKEENEEMSYIYKDISEETIIVNEEKFTTLGVTQPPSSIYEGNEAHLNEETGHTALEDKEDPDDSNSSSADEDLSADEDWEPEQSTGRKRPVNKGKKKSVTSADRNVVESHSNKNTGSKCPRRTVPLRPNGLSDCDETIFCFECGLDHVGDCPVHGPLAIILDIPVAADDQDKHRAKNTAPSMIFVNAPGNPEAENGVWAREEIPARIRFGPCQGKIVSVEVFTPYAWVIRKNGQPHHCLDATEPGQSNWMRYVNCARHRSEQNVAAFQYKGEIYYQTIRTIKAGEELLVWYGDDYGTTDLGNEEKTKFECPGCPYAFSTELFLKRHEKYCRHHQMDSRLVKEVNDCESEDSEVDEPLPPTTISVEKPTTISFEKPTTISVEEPSTISGKAGTNSRHEDVSGVRVCISEASDGSEAIYKCETCSEWFFDENTFRTHRKSHSGSEDDTLYYYCPKCERPFARKYHLTSHIRIKHNDCPHKCDRCDRSFGRKADLTMHLRTHVDKGFITCEYCDKKFLLEDRYKKHLAKHQQGLLFVCPKCGQDFIRKSTFDKHMEKHDEGPQYACDECDKKFSQKRHLTTHMRSHNGEQPHECTECGKKFSLRENYMRHLRSHTGDKPFACGKCGKRFAIKGNLRNHEWTHSDKKPHVCDICSKQFAEKNSLTRHLRTHSGEKPYLCSLCDQRFARKHHVKLHLQKHLKKDGEVVFLDCQDEIELKIY